METKTALFQGLAPVQNQQIMLRPVPVPVTNVKTNYKSKVSKSLSILQIVGGILMLVFALGTTLPLFYDGRGLMIKLLSGAGFDTILLIICGGIGIGASKKKTSCLIISHMVLCILASICVFNRMFQGMVTVAWIVDDMGHSYTPYNPYSDDFIEPPKDYVNYPEEPDMPWGSGDFGSSPYPLIVDPMPTPVTCFGWISDPSRHKISLGMGGVLILLCLMEFIVCVWGSALACKVTCCCGSNGENYVNPGFQYGQIDPGNPHVVVINGRGYPVGTGPVVHPKLESPLTKEQEAWGTQAEMPPPPY